MLFSQCITSVLTCRSPDIERYTISSNGRLGRMLLDAELCQDSASKADKDQARDAMLCTQSDNLGRSEPVDLISPCFAP